MNGIAKLLMISGAILLVLGGIIWLLGSRLNWFGKLPGDIRVERENFSFYAPLTSMILISIVLTVIVFLIRKFR